MRAENGVFGGTTWQWIESGSAWCMQNLWDHYTFTGDKEYLRTLAYPMMKEVCEFWQDRLKALPDGTLVAPNGFSPEHGPREDGVSHDQQLIWDVFNNTVAATDALGVDREFRNDIAAKRDKLLAPKIGKWGQLQEWMVDRDDPKDDHRHMSHLVALHPGNQITMQKTPALAEAARVSLNARGDVSTGWSTAWKINLWARLHDGDRGRGGGALAAVGALAARQEQLPSLRQDEPVGGVLPLWRVAVLLAVLLDQLVHGTAVAKPGFEAVIVRAAQIIQNHA
jgi:alpha-L-fucosidase 2